MRDTGFPEGLRFSISTTPIQLPGGWLIPQVRQQLDLM